MADSPTPTHEPGFRLRRLALVALGTIALCAIGGVIYQSTTTARERRAHPMPGQLVDVGGYKMHIDCVGAGSPVVILESGLGDSYMSWQKVQPQIARFTRACSYDRAGLGYSDSSPHPRTSKDIAEELHTLLHNAGIAGPFVLVAHSIGGFYVRLFASLYRSEVAGMVFVDTSHPEQQKRFPPEVNDMDSTWVREQEFLAALMPFGIPRILGFCGSDPAVRAAECNFHSVCEGIAEMKATRDSAAQTAATGSLGDILLAVLSQDPAAPHFDLPEDLVKPTVYAWSKMQDELAQLSTRSTHLIVNNSGHYIQLDRPDVVVEVVRNLVDEARRAERTRR